MISIIIPVYRVEAYLGECVEVLVLKQEEKMKKERFW